MFCILHQSHLISPNLIDPAPNERLSRCGVIRIRSSGHKQVFHVYACMERYVTMLPNGFLWPLAISPISPFQSSWSFISAEIRQIYLLDALSFRNTPFGRWMRSFSAVCLNWVSLMSIIVLWSVQVMGTWTNFVCTMTRWPLKTPRRESGGGAGRATVFLDEQR